MKLPVAMRADEITEDDVERLYQAAITQLVEKYYSLGFQEGLPADHVGDQLACAERSPDRRAHVEGGVRDAAGGRDGR